MKIKKFAAPSMPQALQQVRDELGDEAVILNTRKLSGRERSRDEQVEITAALEVAPAAAAAPAAGPATRLASAGAGATSLLSRMYGDRGPLTSDPAGTPEATKPPARRLDLASVVPNIRPPVDRLSRPAEGLDRDRVPSPAPARPDYARSASLDQLQEAVERMERLSAGLSLPPQLSQLADRLRRAGLSDELVRECVHGLFQRLDSQQLIDPEVVSGAAATMLKDRLPARGDIRIGRDRRVVGFVGASGSGKTTAIAKIAAGFAAKMRKRGQGTGSIVIISTDTRRVGGLEQARSYAELIGVPLEVVYEAAEMRAAMERHSSARLVLIDTPGCGVREVEERERHRRLLEVAGADQVHVVVDGLTGLDHMLDLIAATEGLGDRRLLFSKIDEVLRPGALLSAAAGSGLSISYLTAGPALPGGIRPGDLDALVDQVVGGPDSHGGAPGSMAN